MKLINNFLSFITAAACSAAISGIMPFSSSAEASATYGDLSYTTVDSDGDGADDYVEITDCYESVTEIEIPAEIEGLPVKSLNSNILSYCKKLKSIHVSESNNYYCSADGILFNKDQTALIKFPPAKIVQEYIVPNNVINIEQYAFHNCESITQITIQEYVSKIEDYCFSGCYNLENIIVTNNNKNFTSLSGVLYNKECTKIIRYPIAKIQTHYKINDNVVHIEKGAFANCANLLYIVFPENLINIGDFSFASCCNLLEISIPETVTIIGSWAFVNCYNLNNLIIPENITSIGQNAFIYCDGLTKLTLINPNCEIFDAKDTISETTAIYGYENSTAQTYAEKYNRNFVSLGEYTETLIGDISGNGEIDLYDAIEIAKAIMGMRTFTEEEKLIADFNKDGTVDLYDAIEIARTLLPK